MEKDLDKYRQSYGKNALLEAGLPDNPIALFASWFNEMKDGDVFGDPNAMTLATAGLDGYPRSRVVLLKQYGDEGFVFFTNYNSEKGKAISRMPEVSLSFYWPMQERQVLVKGLAEKVPAEVSDHYFESRPEGSKYSAIASEQSSVIPSREVLEAAVASLETRFRHKKMKRPDHWGGYVVKASVIEFWQGRPNRLHDRIRYSLRQGRWIIERLAP